MKRFSSALCLADKQRQQVDSKQPASVGQSICRECGQKYVATNQQHKCHHQQPLEDPLSARELKARRRKPQKGFGASKQRNKSKSEFPEVPRLVEPINDDEEPRRPMGIMMDPMILARQRRPSLCNQASVNVDQQGE